MVNDFMFTSVDAGHRHKWKRGLRFTSFNDKHKHKVNVQRMAALPNRKGGHAHKLLKKKVK